MRKTVEWSVRLHLSEEDGTTRARAVLDIGTQSLTGQGTARCNPEDLDVPEIGDELAAGRAMEHLAGQLMRVADRDLESVGAGAPVDRRTAYGWTDAMS
ncbi:DUF1876 domain-containing protein [Streptomyces sp. NPDC017993]|uniref:DUF1876 domain-containing protein n=1 Tax=Streptomyces sp. NPDC017993 TaxID=3365027 RepID=UPI0037934E19